MSMFWNHTAKFVTAFCLTSLLAGCWLEGEDDDGSGDEAPPSNSASSSPSLGLVTNATVNFYRSDGITLLGSADTGSSGEVTIDAGGYSGPVVVEVLGDDVDAMYFDESLGTTRPFPEGQAFHALAPSPSTLGVTPLTELAYQAAVRQGLFPISAAAVNELNEIVRASLAPSLASILTVPALLGDPAVTRLEGNQSGAYALILAALAELGAGHASGAPALAAMNALVADLADGQIDGDNNGTPIGAPYNNFLSEMEANLNSMASTYSFAGDPAAHRPVSTTVDTSGVTNPDDTEAPSNDRSAPPELLALAGSYSPEIVRKEEAFATAYGIEQVLPVTIEQDRGVVTVNNQFVFDPNDTSYVFSNRLSGRAPYLEVQVTDSSGDTLRYRAYVENSVIVAHEFSRGGNQSGLVEASEAPLPQEYTAFFESALALPQPLELTLVQDDGSYNSGFESGGLCSPANLQSNDGAAASDANRSVPFQVTVQMQGDPTWTYDFYRSTSRLIQADDNRSLGFEEGVRLTLRADGEVDLEAVFQGQVRDRLTTDDSEISAVGCDQGQADPPAEDEPEQNANAEPEQVPRDAQAAAVNVSDGGRKYRSGDSFLPEQEGFAFNNEDQHAVLFSGDGIRRFQLSGLPMAEGSYECGLRPVSGSQTVTMNLDVVYDSRNSNSRCRIILEEFDDEIVEGRYVATLYNRNSTDRVSIRGDFRYEIESDDD